MQLLMLCLLSLFLLTASPRAKADSCSGSTGTYTVNLPASVTVPRDAAVGTILTGWTMSSGTYIGMWSCTVTTSGGGPGAEGRSLLASSGTQVSYGGQTYTVFNTGYPGIGMIIAFYDGETGCGGGFYNEGSISPSVFLGGGCYNYGSGPSGAEISVALVKTGQAAAGTLSNMSIAQAAPAITTASGTIGFYTSYTVSFQTTPVQIVNGSCTTPDVSIPLGNFLTSTFAGTGSTSSAASFTINVNNCPVGMNSVKYRIDPTTTVMNSAQSVVALDSTSTATGVGVQLMNSAGSAAFPLSTAQTLSSYSSSTGGSYTIALKARYYQTASSVTPGPANTSMTVTMTYQ